jgi:pantoate--beta-alanine ligase
VKVARDRATLRALRSDLLDPVAFVPTMGALHAGHEALVRAARSDSGSVVASIFVNPTQFGPGEDFKRYPRNEEADLAMLEAAGVHLTFLPSVEDIYPAGASTYVDVGPIGSVLEGAQRPGHFRGVATVVTILFDLVAPNRAFFGQKDGQQAVVVKKLVRDLGLPVEIVVCPTVREPDGLALSSRNVYLSVEERTQAVVLNRALEAAAEAVQRGERSADRLRAVMAGEISVAPLGTPDYLSVADAETLEELQSVDRPALASLAVRFPSARLIDCMLLAVDVAQ